MRLATEIKMFALQAIMYPPMQNGLFLRITLPIMDMDTGVAVMILPRLWQLLGDGIHPQQPEHQVTNRVAITAAVFQPLRVVTVMAHSSVLGLVTIGVLI